MGSFVIPTWLSHAGCVAIVGMGREGQSTYAFLRARFPTLLLNLYDEVWNEQLLERVRQDQLSTVYAGALESQRIQGGIVFKTPGIPPEKLILDQPSSQRITSQADVFFELFSPQIIAVTGTKGKSTTSHLIAHVLKECGESVLLVGNIGEPMLDHVQEITPATQIIVETSSFQAQTIHNGPRISVFLNLYPEHLDYYQTIQEYLAAKRNLFETQQATDLCIHSLDQEQVVAAVTPLPPQKIGISAHDHPQAQATAAADGLYWHGEKIVDRNSIALRGDHNVFNCLPALVIAKQLGYSSDKIQAAFASATPLPGRLEPVATVNEITFYDDALATIPEATIAALNALGSTVHTLIVGGHERKQTFDALADAIAASSVQTLLYFPTTGSRIAEAVVARKPIHTLAVHSMQEAVDSAFTATPKGASVLLSTASPSFGLFKDYRDRSTQYLQCIHSHAPDHS